MVISELFHSIQGEGELAGTPSVFVRTSGCNLRCRWCDTPYTSWEPTGFREDWRATAGRTLALCRGHGTGHVVLTGGEPLLQPAVVPFTRHLAAAGVHVTVETAGTVWRDAHADLWSLSPKLVNSTPDDPRRGPRHERTRENPEVINRLLAAGDYQLKFVTDTPADIDAVEDWLARHPAADRGRVFLMPQARTREQLAAKEPWVQDLAAARGLRYGPRLHVARWGDRRGV